MKVANDPEQHVTENTAGQTATDDTGGVKSYEAPERVGPSLGGMSVGRVVSIVVVILAIILLLNWIF